MKHLSSSILPTLPPCTTLIQHLLDKLLTQLHYVSRFEGKQHQQGVKNIQRALDLHMKIPEAVSR